MILNGFVVILEGVDNGRRRRRRAPSVGLRQSQQLITKADLIKTVDRILFHVNLLSDSLRPTSRPNEASSSLSERMQRANDLFLPQAKIYFYHLRCIQHPTLKQISLTVCEHNCKFEETSQARSQESVDGNKLSESIGE